MEGGGDLSGQTIRKNVCVILKVVEYPVEFNCINLF